VNIMHNESPAVALFLPEKPRRVVGPESPMERRTADGRVEIETSIRRLGPVDRADAPEIVTAMIFRGGIGNCYRRAAQTRAPRAPREPAKLSLVSHSRRQRTGPID